MEIENWKPTQFQRVRLKDRTSVILRHPVLRQLRVSMHVLAGVEIDKSGEAVSRMSNGALVAEFVHVIDVELIAKTTTLFMSRKYAELVTREALREEEIAEQQAVSQNKQVLLARIRAREAQ